MSNINRELEMIESIKSVRTKNRLKNKKRREKLKIAIELNKTKFYN